MAGESGGGSKRILEIPIDDAQWQSFLTSFHDYQSLLEKQSSAWSSTNSGVRQLNNAFESAESSLDGLVDKASSQKFSGPTGGVFARIDKQSRETARSWVSISKEIEKSGRNLSGLVRDGSKFSALGGFLGLGGIAVGASAIFGAVRSADASLADQNLLNRKLGLAPGEQEAFDTTYGPAGGDDALLHKVANAQAHQDQWKSFLALGLTQGQITGMDPAHLAAEVLRRAGEQFNARGPSAGVWADATGVSSLVDTNSMRLAGSYHGQFGEMGKEFEQLIPKLAASQKQLDEATKARQQLEAALARDTLELDKAFIKLNPLIIKGADAVTGWVTTFAESKALTDDIHVVEDAFNKLGSAADWLADKLNHPFHPGDLGHVGSDGTPVPFHVDKDHPLGTVGRDPSGESPNFIARWWNSLGNDSKASDTASRKGADAGGAINNPGNLRVAGSTTQFQQFPTPDAGVLAMDRQLQLYAERDHLNTLQGIISKYAPSSENDTKSYIADVSSRTGFLSDQPLDMGDPAIRAAVEAAMVRHENGTKYSQFNQQHIRDMLTGKTMPDDSSKPQKSAFEKHTKADDTTGDMKILPYTAEDARAIADSNKPNSAAVSESLVDRITRGLGVIGSTLRDGGGAGLRGDDTTSKRIDRQGNTLSSVNVVVSAPTGSSTVVTASTIAQ